MLFESENEIMEKKSCFSNTYIHFFPGKKNMLEWEKNGQPPGKSRKPWLLQPKNRAPVP
jgi:hypothetical protein